MGALSVHHIPVCPFSQRLEILLALKGLAGKVELHVVDITKPRDPALLAKTPGTSALPFLEAKYARVRRWRDACIAHPSAQQVTREEIIKLYYDYARGAGNGALLPGRERFLVRLRSALVETAHAPARQVGPGRHRRGARARRAVIGRRCFRDACRLQF